jgi:hypothetical protein
MWWLASATPLAGMGFRPRCSPTTPRCSPPLPGVVVDAPSRSSSLPWASPSATPPPTTPRPAGRWSGSTRPSRSGSRSSDGPGPFASSGSSSSGSAATTTLSGRTGRWGGGPPGGLRGPAQGGAPQGLVIPGHYRVRQDKIDAVGRVTLRHNSRLHHIGLGRRLAGTRVLLLVADLQVRVLTQDGELLRELTLDPSRDYQPQG